MTVGCSLRDRAPSDEMLQEGMEEGVAEAMDRLAELLAGQGVAKKAS